MNENNVENEVMETTTGELMEREESGNGLKTAAIVGLVIVAGGLVGKFVAKPVMTKVKQRKQSRKSEVVVDADAVVEDDFEENSDSDNEENED